MLALPVCRYDKVRRIGLVPAQPGSASPDRQAPFVTVVPAVPAPRTFEDPYTTGGFPSVLYSC